MLSGYCRIDAIIARVTEIDWLVIQLMFFPQLKIECREPLSVLYIYNMFYVTNFIKSLKTHMLHLTFYDV